ncbi:MAG: LysR family transcriptional regulator, partial [Mesorhizobium sp.]
MDRLTSMAVFVKTVDLGSFAAAAAALDLSGPMVGKHVRFLEERLGVRLINRTTRRQSLTDFGRAYYERCRLVLAEAEAADALAADQLSEPRGKLRVIMPVHFGRRCVAPILLELAQRYPALELDLSFSDPIADLAEDGCDLAIRTGILEVMPVSRLRLDDLAAIADAAAAGMGLAWLPYWLVREHIQAGALVVLLPEQPGFLYDAYALWLQTPHLPLKVRLAVDALAAALPRL